MKASFLLALSLLAATALSSAAAEAAKFRLLYSFTGGADGGNPGPAIARDASGNLYGTTYSSIFEISPTGATTTLYSFPHYGSYPLTDSPHGQIVRDQSGNIFGTTFFGLGGVGCNCGTVYELTKSGVKKTLHVFSGGNDGEYPDGLTIDKSGQLFGAAAEGPYGAGVVYELTP